MLRTRSRATHVEIDYVCDTIEDSSLPTGPFPGTLDLGIVRTLQKSEVISDTVNARDSFNPCSHQRCKFSGAGKPPPLTFPNVYSYYKSVTRPGWIFYGVFDLPQPSGSQINDFAWQSFLNATTQVPEEISIGNFSLELGEIKDVVLKWSKKIADNFLKWEFGLKPFLSDIATILGVVEAAQKRLDFLRETAGKTVTIHNRREVIFEDDGQNEAPPMESILSDTLSMEMTVFKSAYLTAKRSQIRATLYSSIKVRNDLQGLDAASAYLDTLAAMVGLQNPFKIAWNAFPFSFVLEYFVKLGNVLDSLQLQSFSGELVVVDSCYTIKSESVYDLYGCNNVIHRVESPTPDIILDYKDFPYEKIGVAFNSSYVRRSGLPLGNSVYLTEGLSANQLAILAALAEQFR
jgi:hypothetical protein